MHFSFHPTETEPERVAPGWQVYTHQDPLEAFRRAITKRAISGIIWNDGYRKTDNFAYSDFLVLDIDDGMTIDEAKDKLQDVSHIIGTSRSHQKIKPGNKPKPACDRFRVVIPWEHRIENVEDYRHTIRKYIDAWGADTKRGCAASYFRPCLEVVSYLPISLDLYGADTYKAPPKKERKSKTISEYDGDVFEYLRREQRAVFEFLTQGRIFNGGRNGSIRMTTQQLKQIGIGHDEIKGLIKSVKISWDDFSEKEFNQATRWE